MPDDPNSWGDPDAMAAIDEAHEKLKELGYSKVEVVGFNNWPQCPLCLMGVDPHAEETYKEVVGWVHGKKKDSLTMREDTGRFAHPACVLKLKEGQAVDQPSIFDGT